MNSQPKPKAKNFQSKQKVVKTDVVTKPPIFRKKKQVFKTEDICPHCKVSIALSSLDTHVEYCKKKPRFKSTREVHVYDSVAARIHGTEAAQYHLKPMQIQSGNNRGYKHPSSSITGKTGTNPNAFSQAKGDNKTKKGRAVTTSSPKEKGNWREVRASTLQSIHDAGHDAASNKMKDENSNEIIVGPDSIRAKTGDSEASQWRQTHASTLRSIRSARNRAAAATGMNSKTNVKLIEPKIYVSPRKSTKLDPAKVMDLYIPNEIWPDKPPGGKPGRPRKY